MAKGSWKRTIQLLGNNRDVIRKLNQTNNKLDTNAAKAEGTQKRNTKSFKAIGVAVTAMVITIGIAVAKAIAEFSEFEQTIADLAAISKATTSELAEMEAQALRLGRTTKFTASQVATLQKEYSKLGFSVREITAATDATLNLAAATGEDLANSASVAGITVRAFQLDTTETGRVVDTMAASFRNSALDMDKFTNSMKFVAPIANSAGYSVENTTAIMGALADIGISGSLSGTALRQVFLELSRDSSKLAKRLGGPVKSMDDLLAAMRKLKAEEADLGDASDLVGKRASSAFLGMIENVDRIEELNKVLDESAGVAKRMAEIQMDTLRGASLEAKSATEGLKIAFVDLIDDGLVRATDAYTNFINVITDAIQIPVSEKLQEEKTEFNALMRILMDVNTLQDTRNKAIETLQDNYGEYLLNINLETSSTEDLTKALKDVNKQMLERIKIAAQAEILEEAERKIFKARKNLYEQELKLGKIEIEGVQTVRQKGEVVQNTAIAISNQTKVVDNHRAALEKEMEAYNNLVIALGEISQAEEDRSKKTKIRVVDIGGGEDDPDGPLQDEELKRFLVKESWAKRGLELDNEMYKARLAAVDTYYARQEAALLDAGLTEAEITQRIDDEKAEIKRQSNTIMYELAAQGLGGLVALSQAFGKKTSLISKRLAQFEIFVSTIASAQKAYETGLKSPIPPPGNVIFAKGLSIAAYAGGMAKIAMVESRKFGEGAIFTKPVFSPFLKGGATIAEPGAGPEAVIPLGKSGGIFGLMLKEIKILNRDLKKIAPIVNIRSEIDGIEFYEEQVRPASQEVDGSEW